MTSDERFREAQSPAEHLAVLHAKRRGLEQPRFETDEYRRRRADALRAAGLDDEAAESTPESDLERVKRH